MDKATIDYINDQEGCPCFLMNHFINPDYEQFIKISQSAPWPLFSYTFITGGGGRGGGKREYNITAVLDLGHKQNMVRKTEFSATECWYSYFNGTLKKQNICTNSKKMFQNLFV